MDAAASVLVFSTVFSVTFLSFLVFFRVSVEEDDLLSALLRMFVGLKRTWDVAPAERVQGRSSSPTGVWPSR